MRGCVVTFQLLLAAINGRPRGRVGEGITRFQLLLAAINGFGLRDWLARQAAFQLLLAAINGRSWPATRPSSRSFQLLLAAINGAPTHTLTPLIPNDLGFAAKAITSILRVGARCGNLRRSTTMNLNHCKSMAYLPPCQTTSLPHNRNTPHRRLQKLVGTTPLHPHHLLV